MENGVIYIVTNNLHLERAICSAKSMRIFNNVSITLFSSVKTDSNIFDNIIEITPLGCFSENNIHYMMKTPYKRTLYIDSDTYISDNIIEMFDLLDYFDIGLVNSFIHKQFPFKEIPSSFVNFDGGVFLYKNSNLNNAFFQTWLLTYYELLNNHSIKKNEPSLLKALYFSKIRIVTLPIEYNCRIDKTGVLQEKVKIFHSKINIAYWSDLALGFNNDINNRYFANNQLFEIENNQLLFDYNKYFI